MASLLSCQVDSYIKYGKSNIISCVKDPKKKNTYNMHLDNSILYPEGGGQPCDLGSVDGHKIVKVDKVGGGSDDSSTNSLISVTVEVDVSNSDSCFTEGKSVECVLDWERRYDFMQQHTSQHIISGLAYKLFKFETVSWSLSSDYVSVDLVCGNDSGPSVEGKLGELEAAVNAAVRAMLPVELLSYSAEEVLAVQATGGATSGPLQQLRGHISPKLAGLTSLRFVYLPGIDLNACGGTHVRNTAELQLFKLFGGVERDRAKGITRLKFMAGGRCFARLGDSLLREASLAQILCVPPAQFVVSLEKSRADRKIAVKEATDLAAELSLAIAQRIISTLDAQLNCCQGIGPVNVVVAYHRWGVGDYDFLGRIINVLAARYRNANHPDFLPGQREFNCAFYFSCCNDGATTLSVNVPSTVVPKSKGKGKDDKGKKGVLKQSELQPMPPPAPPLVPPTDIGAPVTSGNVMSVCAFDGSDGLSLLPHSAIPERFHPVPVGEGMSGIWMLFQSWTVAKASLKDGVLALNGGKGGGLVNPTVVRCQGQGTHLECLADVYSLLKQHCN